MPSQRDIVLVPVPFTDLSSLRRRPVVIISNNEYNKLTDYIVVVAMTSNPESTKYGEEETDTLLFGEVWRKRDEFAWRSPEQPLSD